MTRAGVALVRAPSASLARCELSFIGREPIDLGRARAEHEAYCKALRAAGLEVIVLPALDDLPDAAFVEDTAVVVDEVAALGAPGVASRAAEVEAIAPVVATYRPVHRLSSAGATLEGGDVLRIGKRVYVGRSSRTNAPGAADLRALLEPLGYRVREVEVHGCLHLKTGCGDIGGDAVLLNPAWVDREPFERDGLRVVEVDRDEAWAANTIRLGEHLVRASGNPATRRSLESLGRRVHEVAIGEFQKAEAGVTCLSLLL